MRPTDVHVRRGREMPSSQPEETGVHFLTALALDGWILSYILAAGPWRTEWKRGTTETSGVRGSGIARHK